MGTFTSGNYVPCQYTSPSPASQTTVSVPPTYTIVLREFIRGNYIAGPGYCVPGLYVNGVPPGFGTYFHGDSRNFMATPSQESPPSNPFRAMQTAILQPESAAAGNGVGGQATGLSGTTREYDSGSLTPGFDPAGSGLILNPSILDNVVTCSGGANEIGQMTASNPPAPSSPTRVNAHAVSVQLVGSGVNPLTLSIFTPAFKWNVTVTVDHSNPAAVKASASGTHTCFPANEIWITSSSNASSPYYIWEYGPGGASPNAMDESISYLTGCLTGAFSAINVTGSTTLPK
jgi:hypothetical protein